MRRNTLSGLGVAALVAVTIACSSSNPTAPTPPAANAPASSSLKVSAPVPQSPINSQVVKGVSVMLSAGPSAAQFVGSPALQYRFELRKGGSLNDSALMNRPSWAIGKKLNYSTTYQWRVRAESDGVASDWSAMVAFRTPNPPDPTAKCGPPTRTAPRSIIQCHRNLYPDHMSDAQAVKFLKGAARHFNMARVPGGPYGLLQKKFGNNCNGFSCDILCAGQGSRQRQYDVLINDRIANWGSPLGDGQRTDVCAIQRP